MIINNRLIRVRTAGPMDTPPSLAALQQGVTSETLLGFFTEALEARTVRLSPETVNRQRRHVRDWFAYCNSRSPRVDVLAPSALEIERFASRAKVAAGLYPGAGTKLPSRSVTAQRLSALTNFYDVMVAAGLASANLARPLPAPRQVPNVDGRRLTPEEIARVLEAAQGDSPPVYAMFRVLADTGCRGIELQRARVKDFRPDGDGGPVLYVVGRGNRGAVRPLPRVTVEALRDSLEWQRSVCPPFAAKGPLRPLFGTRVGGRFGPLGPLDHNRLSRVFGRVVRASGIDEPKEITVHAFRHAWVRHGVACGFAVTDVQSEIGHRSLSSTLAYLHGGVGRLHPLASQIRPLAATVADAVVMLRAISGGESGPVVAEFLARRQEADAARQSFEVLRKLAAAQAEADRYRGELERLRLLAGQVSPGELAAEVEAGGIRDGLADEFAARGGVL
ncbi:tyrosine-type recombinase/integrase [Streptomyces sp. NPDC090085]|uniref:tyrosine-type recombinase/integrase n=1 Tax=Streptomyces sp. NPDC090085 TaxID=3365943 RepID=UPI0037FDE2AC